MADREASDRLGDEVDVVSLDVLEDHDLHLGKEVERLFAHSVTEDALLNQQHVAARLLDLLAQLQDVVTLLLDHTVNLLVVLDRHLRFVLYCFCVIFKKN